MFLILVAPTIDKGAGGSKSVKVNRMTVWRINVKGEPPPTFTWWKDGKQIVNNEEFQVSFLRDRNMILTQSNHTSI